MSKISHEESLFLKEIIKKTLKSIEDSKEEIFGIVNHVKEDLQRIKSELSEVRDQAENVIESVDRYELKDRLARRKLAIVSQDFENFTEVDIKKAYEEANEIRLRYHQLKFKETQYIDQRNDLERQLINTRKILKNGETLIGKINVVFDYLSQGDMNSHKNEKTSKEEKINLAIQMLEAREQEKKRISREIHDGPAQSLASIVFQAEICSNMIKKDVDKGLEEIEGLKEIVKKTLEEIRGIIYELRPMSIDDIGLIPTIKKMVKNFEKTEGIKVNLKTGKIKEELDQFIELTVFRMIQEILNNIKKHSKATEVNIQISFGTVFMTIKAEDNGNGFDVDKTISQIKEEGMNYGLIGLINRVEEILGEITIESEKSKGTKIYAKIPISKDVMLDEIKVD